jgi:hypothetical protein
LFPAISIQHFSTMRAAPVRREADQRRERTGMPTHGDRKAMRA